jgi:hypothetical protein
MPDFQRGYLFRSTLKRPPPVVMQLGSPPVAFFQLESPTAPPVIAEEVMVLAFSLSVQAGHSSLGSSW